MKVALTLVPFFLLSCGYRMGGLVSHPEVGLEILDNRTERRGHEFDLSALLAREMMGAGIVVNAPEAPVKLVGEIVNFDQPGVVETGQDDVLVGSVAVRLKLSLLNTRDNKVIWKDVRTESALFSMAREESRDTAKQEVFARLTRWAVTKLEKDW